jgi:putative nucleotidyltransferase with HDIG domain
MKVIVEATYLKKGMYVSELDRPWLESPFLFQGFRITNNEEVEQIRSLCAFVYVDIEKSKVPVTQTMSKAAPAGLKPEKQNYARVIREPLPYTEEFEDELSRAWDCQQLAKDEVSTLFEDVRMGNSLDVGGARTTVTGMVDSILRHPDALVLLTTLGNKDRGLVTHALSVCTLSLAFGRYLGLKEEELVDLGLGALLHDIGKIKVPDEVLDNIANASEEERALLEGHTLIGAMMLKNIKGLPDNVIAIVHDHHERANGSGYPRKMTGSGISMHTKIVSIVDTYDSITRGVHGYDSIRADEALKSIYAWRHELFDELLVEKFIQCVGIYPLGSVVELRTGQVGIVISSCPDARLFPRIMLVLDAHRKPVEPPEMINLALFREKLDTNDFEVKQLVDGERYDIDVRQYILRELPLGACPV